MPQSIEETFIVTKIKLLPNSSYAFADWQADFNAAIAIFPGFVSLEITSSYTQEQPYWLVVQRFHNAESLKSWVQSPIRKELLSSLQPILKDGMEGIKDNSKVDFGQQGGITEVFVTQVNPEKEEAYRQWIAKIHQVEAKFPGFRGVYVQSPSQNQGKNWITLLQFDKQENLDRWLSSPERQQVLTESRMLIDSLESHRVISPYAGWFSSLSVKGESPPVWKQTMIILLVLFPLVMLEVKFLMPQLSGLNRSLETFIGNAISVTLVSWPMMPIAIYFLGWWLSPHAGPRQTILGTLIVLGLYVLEVLLFWNLL